ncbi:MAG: hypothetical protein ACRDY2_02285 [Acidimicrobiales bacterium]
MRFSSDQRSVVAAVARRPRLWRTAGSAVLLLARERWWRRWPFLPLPSRAWIEFRLECATGEPDGPLVADDVLAWLEWCRAMPRRPR